MDGFGNGWGDVCGQKEVMENAGVFCAASLVRDEGKESAAKSNRNFCEGNILGGENYEE